MTNRPDQLSSLFFLALAVGICHEGARSSIGSLFHPASGFLPFWSGVVLGLVSLVLFVRSSFRTGEKVSLSGLWHGVRLARLCTVIVSLFVYLLVLPFAGYLVATFCLMVLLLSVLGAARVWTPVAGSLIIVVAAYVVFAVLLQMQLPKGMLGF